MAPSSVFVQYTGPRIFPEHPVRQWLHALVRSGIFVGLAVLFFTIGYQTGTDSANQLVLSGISVAPEPDGRVEHLHPAIGYLLAQLCRLNAEVSWYALTLVLAHWLGIASAWLALQRIGGGAWRGGVFWLLMFFVEWPFLQDLQLTTSSFVLAQGAVLLLRTADDPRERPWSYLLVPIGLFAGAALLRWESAFLSALVALPLFFFREEKNWAKRLWLGALLLAISFAMGLRGLSLDFGKDRYETEARGVRAAIVDYADHRYAWTTDNAPRFARAGWTQNDHHLYRMGFAADTSVFGPGALLRLKTAMSSAEGTPLSVRLQRALDVFRAMPPHVERSCLLFLLLVPSVPSEERRRTFVGSIFLVLASAMVLSGWFHLPDHIFQPLFAWPVLAGLWLTPPLRIMGGCYRVIVTVAALWCAFYGVRTAKAASGKTESDYHRWRASLERLDPWPDQLYLTTGDYLHRVALPFKRPGDPLLKRFKTLDLGPLSDWPAGQRQLQAFGIRHLHAEIVSRTNILLLVPTTDQELRDRYLVFLSEHYGHSAQLVRVWDDPQTGMGAWRVQKN
jgi:hypothetical protein